LWETYLADRTGFGEAEWHFQADRREHVTSAGQLQQLVRTTGNPRFDPHGDPIPTEAGEVPSRYGRPLSDCEPGDDVRIVHVEDEPEAIYAKLRAQAIRVNQRATVLDKSPERICIEVDGAEQAMPPVVAGNVWVIPVPQGAPAEPCERLSSLRVGESRTVVGISAACQGLQRRRLLDLGVIPGTEVTAVFDSPLGNPTAYRVRGALIAHGGTGRFDPDSARNHGRGRAMKRVATLAGCPARDDRRPFPSGLTGGALISWCGAAGNPNGQEHGVQRLTGLRHTGNWPGKTVALGRGRLWSTTPSVTVWSITRPTPCASSYDEMLAIFSYSGSQT
jgi:Fe2+ transport system protein FeoA